MCLDYQQWCFSWTLQSTTDPLAFWPPLEYSISNSTDIRSGSTSSRLQRGPFQRQFPPDAYLDAQISSLNTNQCMFNSFFHFGNSFSQTVNVIDISKLAGNFINSFDEMRTNNTLYVLSITNADGQPVDLPNDGPVFSNSSLSMNNYLSNIAYRSIELITDLSALCSFQNFKSQTKLVSDVIDVALNQTTLTDVLKSQVY